MISFGKGLRSIRKQKDLTQEKLDLVSGLALGTTAQYEGERREPTLENLIKLKIGLQLNYYELGALIEGKALLEQIEQ